MFNFKKIKELENRIVLLEKENDSLKIENHILKESGFVIRKYLDIKKQFESLDPSPIDSNERKSYVGKVISFYNDIFKDKLECMMAQQKDNLSLVGLPDWEYNIYRASVNVISLLMDWGDRMNAEYMSYIQEEKEQREEGKNSEQKLKDKLNND